MNRKDIPHLTQTELQSTKCRNCVHGVWEYGYIHPSSSTPKIVFHCNCGQFHQTTNPHFLKLSCSFYTNWKGEERTIKEWIDYLTYYFSQSKKVGVSNLQASILVAEWI